MDGACARLCELREVVYTLNVGYAEAETSTKGELQTMRVVMLQEMQRAGVSCVRVPIDGSTESSLYLFIDAYITTRAPSEELIADALRSLLNHGGIFSLVEWTQHSEEHRERFRVAFIDALERSVTTSKAYVRLCARPKRGMHAEEPHVLGDTGRRVALEMVRLVDELELAKRRHKECRRLRAARGEMEQIEAQLIAEASLRSRGHAIGDRVVRVRESVRRKALTKKETLHVVGRAIDNLGDYQTASEFVQALVREIGEARDRGAVRKMVLSVVSKGRNRQS